MATGYRKPSRTSTDLCATLLEDAEPEILAFYAFPAAHWRNLRATKPLERVNKENGWRTNVVAIFPTTAR